MDTLYLTDLDGTLLGVDSKVSPFTRDAVNFLLASGVKITVATGRAWNTLSCVKEIHWSLPMVVLDGSRIQEFSTGRVLWEKTLEEGATARVLALCAEAGLYPLLFAQDARDAQKVYYADADIALTAFVEKSIARGDARFARVGSLADTFGGNKLFRVTAGGPIDVLRGILAQCIAEGLNGHMYFDGSGEGFLEVAACSKADGVRMLRQMLSPSRIVAFGDNGNDTEMIKTADAGYAVENAHESLRAVATGIIGANTEDGVARAILKMENIRFGG